MKRIFLIVLDSFGIGAMPDSESFGDVGVNTLAACATSDKLHIPNMIAAGLGDLLGKFTCLADWKLAKVINGEHYCDKVVELVELVARYPHFFLYIKHHLSI